MNEKWSKSWKRSEKPGKQRKYRENAPQHVKQKLLSSNVSQDLREELGTRNIRLRAGDQIKVMRGDRTGETGIINEIDYDSQRVFVDGITVERQNGTESQAPLRPSNIQVVAMNVDDDARMEKFDVDRDDFGEIEVDEEEMEEALEEDDENEMMKQMQSGDSSVEEAVEEQEEEEETEETGEKESEEEPGDYGDLVDENIGDVKDSLSEMDEPDYEAVLEAEKRNKDRKTLVEWLERKVDQ